MAPRRSLPRSIRLTIAAALAALPVVAAPLAAAADEAPLAPLSDVTEAVPVDDTIDGALDAVDDVADTTATTVRKTTRPAPTPVRQATRTATATVTDTTADATAAVRQPEQVEVTDPDVGGRTHPKDTVDPVPASPVTVEVTAAAPGAGAAVETSAAPRRTLTPTLPQGPVGAAGVVGDVTAVGVRRARHATGGFSSTMPMYATDYPTVPAPVVRAQDVAEAVAAAAQQQLAAPSSATIGSPIPGAVAAGASAVLVFMAGAGIIGAIGADRLRASEA